MATLLIRGTALPSLPSILIVRLYNADGPGFVSGPEIPYLQNRQPLPALVQAGSGSGGLLGGTGTAKQQKTLRPVQRGVCAGVCERLCALEGTEQAVHCRNYGARHGGHLLSFATASTRRARRGQGKGSVEVLVDLRGRAGPKRAQRNTEVGNNPGPPVSRQHK